MFLKTKLIAIISIVLLLVIGTTTVIVIRLQEAKLIEYKLTDASVLNMIVHNSLRDAMRKNDRPAIAEIISDIGDIPEVMSLSVLNKQGQFSYRILKKRSIQNQGHISPMVTAPPQTNRFSVRQA